MRKISFYICLLKQGKWRILLKKQGDESIMQDMPVREHFIEEMCDTLMYLNDVMLCYGIFTRRIGKSLFKET